MTIDSEARNAGATGIGPDGGHDAGNEAGPGNQTSLNERPEQRKRLPAEKARSAGIFAYPATGNGKTSCVFAAISTATTTALLKRNRSGPVE
jgi:hypothetical protein